MLEDIIKTRTEKRIFRNTLIAFRSYLIKEKRRLKKETLKTNEEILKNMMENHILELVECRAVRVRYNKTDIIEGRPVGYPKLERERFCLEWVDESTNEKKRKYFPFTAIVSVSWFSSSEFVEFNQIVPAINQINFNYNEFGASVQMIEYMRQRVKSVEDVNNTLRELIEVKVSDQLTASQKQERKGAFFKACLNHGDPIVFLFNGKETEGIFDWYCGGNYFIVESSEIRTKNHRKYVPLWRFCRIIDSGRPQ